MPSLFKYLATIIFIGSCFLPGFAQSKTARFISPPGNFRIDDLGTPASVKEISFDQGAVFGEGSQYFWEKEGEYSFNIFYYTIISSEINMALPPSGKPVMSAADKAKFLAPLNKKQAEDAKKCGCPLTEKPFVLNGNNGTEVKFTSPGFESITRFVFVKNRFFSVQVIFNNRADRPRLLAALDSFAALTHEEALKAKLEEAEPKPLPQEPALRKLKTDAQDENLKGKVKSVLEESQEPPAKTREKSAERYFNEAGNLVRDIGYMEGYPSSLSVWGYLDNKRVVSSNDIYFDVDQRPPLRRQILIETAAEDSAKPSDPRYTSSHITNYDDFGNVAEKFVYGSNGKRWSHTAYNYNAAGSGMIEIDYRDDGALPSSTINLMDKNRNVIEARTHDEKGKLQYISIYKYEFDDKGNWIVKRSYEKKTVKGKSILKLESTTYRAITYYP